VRQRYQRTTVVKKSIKKLAQWLHMASYHLTLDNISQSSELDSTSAVMVASSPAQRPSTHHPARKRIGHMSLPQITQLNKQQQRPRYQPSTKPR
jgi:hypothetical protein